jgi:DNA polymerase-3 subunit gamma/tau
MSYQVLARKYRPQRFSEVIGQEHVTRTLQNAIEQGRIAHGYIFSGHRGIGKTTVARILAMALNCRSAARPVTEPCGVCDSCVEIREGRSVDVIEIDAATNRGIDEIRELREAARYEPARDRYKVYILDEAHQITDAAFNALLKTLEEPPPHVIFMLATTQPEDIPQTIRSRCQHFSFHAVRFEEIVSQLREIATREGINADENALAMLAEAGDGSMRDALSIMDQAIACCGTHLTADIVRGLVGAVPSDTLERVLDAVSRNSSEEVLRTLDRLLSEGHSPVHFARQFVRFLRNAIVARVAGGDSALLQISADERSRVARIANLFSEEDLTRFLQIMLRTHSELGWRPEQRFHLELGVLKLVHAQRLLPIETLLTQAEPAAPAGTSRTSVPKAIADPGRAAAVSQPTSSPRPSPFEADVRRKAGPRSEALGETSFSASPAMTATAVAVALEDAEPASADTLRSAVLAALEKSNARVLALMLEEGDWRLQASDLIITVSKPASVVELAFGPELRRIVIAAASEAAGRQLRVRVVGIENSNGSANGNAAAAARDGDTARNRALKDPVVRRMIEKFGADIRTVIDYRDKR